jgi:hypothetical protein
MAGWPSLDQPQPVNRRIPAFALAASLACSSGVVRDRGSVPDDSGYPRGRPQEKSTRQAGQRYGILLMPMQLAAAAMRRVAGEAGPESRGKLGTRSVIAGEEGLGASPRSAAVG